MSRPACAHFHCIKPINRMHPLRGPRRLEHLRLPSNYAHCIHRACRIKSDPPHLSRPCHIEQSSLDLTGSSVLITLETKKRTWQFMQASHSHYIQGGRVLSACTQTTIQNTLMYFSTLFLAECRMDVFRRALLHKRTYKIIQHVPI